MYQPFEVRDVVGSHPLTAVACSRAQRWPCQWPEYGISTPVVEFNAPAPAVSCAVPAPFVDTSQCLTLRLRPWAPVVGYISPAPVRYAASVPVVEDIAPTPEFLALHLHLSVSTWRQRQRSPRAKGTHFVEPLAAVSMNLLGVSSRRRALCVRSSRAVAPRTSRGTSRTGVFDQFQATLYATASLMEDFSNIKGATVNEVGMLSCAMDTHSSPYVRHARRSLSAVPASLMKAGTAASFDQMTAVSGSCRPNARRVVHRIPPIR